MSRVSDLENKVESLERNVGMLAELAHVSHCLRISESDSLFHYNEGITSVREKED